MTGEVEAVVTERGHHLDLVLRHGAEGVVDVVGGARRSDRRYRRSLEGPPRRHGIAYLADIFVWITDFRPIEIRAKLVR